MTAKKRSKAAHDYAGLDRVMHEKARLSILIALLPRADGALFPELRQLCALTDGNLNRHLAVLHEAGLTEVWKQNAGPRSKTRIQLTSRGRREFLAYLEELERVIRDAREAPDAGLAPA
jgi:DNA-binding MarR family transcriptional regulator